MTSQEVGTGQYTLTGITSDGMTILGGCWDVPDCTIQEVETTETVYSFPSIGAYQIILVTPQTENYISAISHTLAPLNKLSDCAGEAASNAIPFGNTIFGTPKDSDPVDAVLKTGEALSENKVPATVVWSLDKVGLPALSEAVENGATKVVSFLSPAAKWFSGAGTVWTGGKFVYDAQACYDKKSD